LGFRGGRGEEGLRESYLAQLLGSGIVPRSAILGKVVMIYQPLSRRQRVGGALLGAVTAAEGTSERGAAEP